METRIERPDEVRRKVRDHYARAVTERSDCCSDERAAKASRLGYAPGDIDLVPVQAAGTSFGCANPVALADLRPGEVVLDLGSGAGLDVLLSARRVGPTGRAYGLDMTPQMLERARENAANAGATNVEFLEGTLETIPLPDRSVDVVISNCVINLSPDKAAVLREVFRVLRPGGRFAVADMVRWSGRSTRRLTPGDPEWRACIGGALGRREYERALTAVGFANVAIEPVEPAPLVIGDTRSAFVRAVRPN